MNKVTSCSLDFNPPALQPFANCGVLNSLANFWPPMNVGENPAPPLLPPPLQGGSSHTRNCMPTTTSMDVESIHGTVLENESRANKAVNQHRPHELQVPLEICSTLPLGTGSFTIQHPFHAPYPTPLMGVAPNPPTRVGGDTTSGVVVPTQETLPVIFPSQLRRRMDWTCPREVRTTPGPIQSAGMTSATPSIVTTIPSESLSSSATTLFPSIEGSSNGSDHGITPSDSQQGTTQELSPCVEYVAPSKGPMSGGIEVTIVGTNIPHTLLLSVYFGTNPALIVSWKHLVRG